MAEHLSIDRVKQCLKALFDGIAQRADRETQLRQRYDDERAALTQTFEAAKQERTDRYESERGEIQSAFDAVCIEATQYYQTHYGTLSEEFDDAVTGANVDFERKSAAAKQEWDDSNWMLQSYFDESAGGTPKQQFEQFDHNLVSTQQHLDVEWSDLLAQEKLIEELQQRRRIWTSIDAAQPAPQTGGAESAELLIERFHQLAAAIRAHASDVRKRSLPILFSGALPLVVFGIGTVLLTGLLYAVVDPKWIKSGDAPLPHIWFAMLGSVAAICSASVQLILLSIARSTGEADLEKLHQYVVDADFARQAWSKQSQRELKRRRKENEDWHESLVKERDAAIKKAEENYKRVIRELNEKRSAILKSANERYPKLLEQLTVDRDAKLAGASGNFPERLKKLGSRFRWDSERIEKEHLAQQDTLRQQFDIDWQAMAQNWIEAVDSTRVSSDRMHAEFSPFARPWPDLAFGKWQVPVRIPPAMRLGEFDFGLKNISYGIPEDDRLMPETTEFRFPALLAFPNQSSLLLKAAGTAGRTAALKLIQNLMLRLLTTIPPGKLRFTIIDPIGLGQDLSAFMHLADYDELLVTRRIWTESQHIEQRLLDLTEHMETVFQTYLRNEFKTIEEYNEFAGEVAEPYHFLVVAGFPANFNESAARRLTSIITSGPKCGVYTLLATDTDMTMPPNFNLSDITSNVISLVWDHERFVLEDPELSWLRFTGDALPEPETYGRIVRQVGEASKDARRVEVSFERVVPKQLWEGDSRSGIDIPLGRAGATKLQHMRLGRGTSQHVLVAGKTGSGKSTLMHILVTNLALHYSPSEVAFYLIDFKKGVEFKTYAANQLPHARVIAIESDREFGLSVLERLDAVLKERGDLFRDHSVQDIGSFRTLKPDVHMPRLLLLVDEFQEFFVEEDKIGQQAALLMDRLVRQGRAFGIHVLLGSQTLGGAYSLARSTLGQVAVRIALQCSEADAHLILSEDNTAARLLSRPGEAIYNDANGLVEGNHPFQIAWLEDDRRDMHLKQIHELAEERGLQLEPPLVFEGNIPANVVINRDFMSLFEADAPTEAPRAVVAWLGEAVAIKPHTEIGFRRSSGSNLLIVGQFAQGARGMLTTALYALAVQLPPLMPASAQHVDFADEETVLLGPDANAPQNEPAPRPETPDPVAALKNFSFANFSLADAAPSAAPQKSVPLPDVAQFYILDGELGEDPEAQFWSDATADLPHHVRIGGPTEADAFITELATVMRARSSPQFEDPIFLLIDNLGRFRSLRRADDDYSFSASNKQTSSVAQMFVDILKNGPVVGIHVLVWCDTYNNASRWMSTQTVRELEMRVAFQMSPADSSSLIDSPIAGKLGSNRALLFLEEQGLLEKFRPYGLPSEELRAMVKQRFSASTASSEDDLEVYEDLSSFTVI